MDTHCEACALTCKRLTPVGWLAVWLFRLLAWRGLAAARRGPFRGSGGRAEPLFFDSDGFGPGPGTWRPGGGTRWMVDLLMLRESQVGRLEKIMALGIGMPSEQTAAIIVKVLGHGGTWRVTPIEWWGRELDLPPPAFSFQE